MKKPGNSLEVCFYLSLSVTLSDHAMTVAYQGPVWYNLSVARELVKQVYHAEGLQPPRSIDAIRTAYRTLWSRASSPVYWRGAISNGEIAKIGIYALEAYGIFKVSLFFIPPSC